MFPIPRAGMGANEFEPILSAAESITDPGYLKMGNGLIIQWGQISVTGSGTTNDTFPLEFPTAVLGCAVTGWATSSANAYLHFVDSGNTTTTTIRLVNKDPVAQICRWIAVGH